MKLLVFIQLLLAAGVVYIIFATNSPFEMNTTNSFKLVIHKSYPSNPPEVPNKPEEPKQPETPTPTEPETPPVKPEEPTKKPEEPAKKPEEPPKKPEEPVKKPEEPPKKPEEPVKKPEETPKEPVKEPKGEENSGPKSHYRSYNNPENPSNNPEVNFKGESLKGKTESEIKWIYHTKERNQTLCQQRNPKPQILCRLGVQSYCMRRYLSEALHSFWMLAPIYTANNVQTRYLYEWHKNFRNYVRSYGMNFQTVEVIFPGQEFQLTETNNTPHDLQYNTEWIFAMRENLINVGVKHLPEDWEYMSWVDQHIFWEDPYWFEKCIWLFAHHNIVHMLNGNHFYNLRNTTDYSLEGFGKLYNQYGSSFEQHNPIRQCGLAWGMRREIFEQLGGLLDICIGTKCDLYQNYAYMGSRYTSQTRNYEYAQAIGAWQDHAIKVYDRKLGYLDSRVYHFMHCIEGCKTSEYGLHVQALMEFNFNPRTDMTRDFEGRLILDKNLPLAQRLWSLYGGAPRRLRRV